MKVLILVCLALLSIIQLHDAVELNSEAIEDGRHGTNRLKREINVGNDNFGVNDNCVGDANCNSKGENLNVGNRNKGGNNINCKGNGVCNSARKKRQVIVENDYGNRMSANCQGPNCNGYRDIRQENHYGRHGGRAKSVYTHT